MQRVRVPQPPAAFDVAVLVPVDREQTAKPGKAGSEATPEVVEPTLLGVDAGHVKEDIPDNVH
jgi:hypothetical protein